MANLLKNVLIFSLTFQAIREYIYTYALTPRYSAVSDCFVHVGTFDPTHPFRRRTVLVEHSAASPGVTSAPRETLRTCEEQCVHIHPQQVSSSLKAAIIAHCPLMIIDSRTMESAEEESQLGAESEEEDSELSDDEVTELLTC